jgi:thioredoxin 1
VSAELFPSLGAADFEFELRAATRPVLVDFWAPSCAQCRLLAPVVRGVADELAGALEVRAVDAAGEAELAIRQGVQSLPTLVLYEGGDEKLRLVGPRGRHSLMAALAPWVGGDPDGRTYHERKDGSS